MWRLSTIFRSLSFSFSETSSSSPCAVSFTFFFLLKLSSTLIIFGLITITTSDHQPHHPFLLLFSSLGLFAAAIVTGEQALIGHYCCCLVVITPQAMQRKIGALDRHQLFPNCHHCCCCYSLQSTSPSHSQQAVFLTIHHQTSSQAAASTSGRQQAVPLPCNVPLLLAVRSLLIGAAFCLLFFRGELECHCCSYHGCRWRSYNQLLSCQDHFSRLWRRAESLISPPGRPCCCHFALFSNRGDWERERRQAATSSPICTVPAVAFLPVDSHPHLNSRRMQALKSS